MTRITLPDVKIRTTSGGDGHPHGVAVGTGPTAASALAAIKNDATRMANELAAVLDNSSAELSDGTEWGIEVVDIRLTPGPDDGWLAYGTMRSVGLSPLVPESSSYWSGS